MMEGAEEMAGLNVEELKTMLASGKRQRRGKKQFVETGGGAKFVGARGNHSNKMTE